MGEELLACRQNGRTLSYVCEERTESGCSLISTHRIIVTRSGWSVAHYVILLLVFFLWGLIIMESGAEFLKPLPVFGALVLYSLRRQRVVQEAIVVMPTLGVQLETVYHSKKVHRRFVPLHKISAPVINEALSPVTCYFYLALLLRGEENLVLTFISLRPPLKMLVPIWKSLCKAVGISMAKPLSQGEGLKAEDDTGIRGSL